MIQGWSAEALNTAPDSANEIHGDEMASKYGFKGGLVPGVTISAYLIQPAVEAWGMDWLDRGVAHVRVSSPLYDREQFTVEVIDSTDTSYAAYLSRPDDSVSAEAQVSLPELPGDAPARRGDEIAERGFIGPKASFETWEQLKANGCKAFRYRWGEKHRMQSYLRDVSRMPDLVSLDGQGYANMGYLLGCSNWILASNAHMNPWVHLETTSRNFRAVPPDTTIIAEMEVADFYEKKGHEFVDAVINLFDEANDAPLCSIDLRAIYRLRGM
jgi:hypothetical protein